MVVRKPEISPMHPTLRPRKAAPARMPCGINPIPSGGLHCGEHKLIVPHLPDESLILPTTLREGTRELRDRVTNLRKFFYVRANFWIRPQSHPHTRLIRIPQGRNVRS